MTAPVIAFFNCRSGVGCEDFEGVALLFAQRRVQVAVYDQDADGPFFPLERHSNGMLDA